MKISSEQASVWLNLAGQLVQIGSGPVGTIVAALNGGGIATDADALAELDERHAQYLVRIARAKHDGGA